MREETLPTCRLVGSCRGYLRDNTRTIGRVHDKMGERLANNAELAFDDCFVPEAWSICFWSAGYREGCARTTVRRLPRSVVPA